MAEKKTAEPKPETDEASTTRATRQVQLRLHLNGAGLRLLPATLLEEVEGGARCAFTHPLTRRRIEGTFPKAKGNGQGWIG